MNGLLEEELREGPGSLLHIDSISPAKDCTALQFANMLARLKGDRDVSRCDHLYPLTACAATKAMTQGERRGRGFI